LAPEAVQLPSGARHFLKPRGGCPHFKCYTVTEEDREIQHANTLTC